MEMDEDAEKKVVDGRGSDIMKLVEKEAVLVDHKFQQLDLDKDGQLSLHQLRPAVSDLGLSPPQGSDHIYSESELLNEFTRKHDKQVLSTDILIGNGMAAGLDPHPILILRIDGEHLRDFVNGPTFEPQMASIFSQVLSTAIESLPRDRHGKMSKEYLRLALDSMAPSAGLPPYGAIEEMDKVTNNVLKMLEVDAGKLVKEDEMKKPLKEILGSIMLQLEGNPISVSSNSVVHEPLASDPSSLLQPPGPPPPPSSPSSTAAY